jgi:hypothetical protein
MVGSILAGTPGTLIVVLMLSLLFGFFNAPNISSCAMALGSTQPLAEMTTRNLPGGKMWPALKCDILTATCEPIV